MECTVNVKTSEVEMNITFCRKSGSPLNQDGCIAAEKQHCELKNTNNRSECPPIFDDILCWEAAAPNTESTFPCPSFVAGFDIPDTYATKKCEGDGHWYIDVNKSSKSWTNYSQCYNPNSTTVTIKLTPPPLNGGDTAVLEEYLPIIKYISQTGYFISFSTLVVAFCIMFYFKKLHCARNKLHMHLFASFIFRAAISFLKDILFVNSVGLTSDIKTRNGTKWFNDEQYIGTNNWECKFVVSLWQYFITANYSWILMEGVYLHNLILLALFSDSSNSIIYYIIFGWGLPAIVTGAYVLARLFLDDTFCWTIHENIYTFLIIRIPTVISILINVLLFANIARVLLLKLRSPITEETRLFRRWARSTLVLVPLFGIHYALFLGMSYSINKNITIEIVWLFCDQLFASFQGFFVAVLYCFLNGEVKTELRPHINNFLSAWQNSATFSFLHCGDFSRSTAGRPSVCTTLSCSSLYTSSVNQRYTSRKSRWDITQANGMKTRHSCTPENYHICNPNEKTCPDHSNHIITHYDSSATLKCSDNCCYSSKGSTQLTDISEITACLGQCDNKEKTESSLDLEMITMVNH